MTFQLGLPVEVAITRQRKVDSKLLEFADTNRHKGHFNDVVVKVENESFPANRLILACYSHYFETMFTVEMKERYEDTLEINCIDVTLWKLLFNFMYTGNITINCANVVGLLAAADYLQVNDVKDFCFEFIESVISVDNCIDILNVANMYGSACLRNKVFDFIVLNFAEVSHSSSLKTLSEDDFTFLASHPNVNVIDNTLLYTTITEWIKVDKESRKHNFPKLFSCIDFSKISPKFFEQKIVTEKLVTENLQSANLLLEAAVKLLKKNVLSSKIFSVGGRDNGSKLSLIYNHFDDIPRDYPDVPQACYGVSAITMDGFVYFICGRVAKIPIEQSTVWRLNLTEEHLEWKKMAPMLVNRKWMGASIFKKMIAVAGGKNVQNSVVNSAEVYDALRNQWQAISPLNEERHDHVMVTCEDCVYALGGEGNNACSLSSVEKLCGIDGKWQMVQPMFIPRSVFATVTCKGKIYAIGGFTRNSGALKSVERYCPQSDEWVAVSSINDGRYGHSACVLHGKIYIAGGLGNYNCHVNSIECYDLSRDQWNIIGTLDKKFYRHSMFAV